MLSVNQQIGKYKIISPIGAGGMGEVFLAEDTRLDRKVALKILPEKFIENAERMRRFVQEAKATSALNHPNIITLHEISEIDNIHFIVTEFIEGKTLNERLEKKSFSVDVALEIGIQIASALQAAHSVCIVHRDIKPENIMIRPDGLVKILDFGIAKLIEKKTEALEAEAANTTLAQTAFGMIIGTAPYMSPEQARGQQTDARTDLWSFGVVLYEMLAGKVPFKGETINHTIVAILEKEPLQLENMPDELQRIVHKALTKDKEMRYQSAKDLLIDLKNLLRTLDIQSELERSASPNREPLTDSFKENVTKLYLEQSIEKTQPDVETKVRSTARINVGGLSFYWKTALSLFIVGLLALTMWRYFGMGTNEDSATGLLKSVAVANWSSGPNEISVEAVFSPDAKMIAFGSARSGATEIWVKPVIGGEPIQVTKNGFYNQYPVWSPNGQEIAFFSSRGNKRGIWRASFTGGEQVKIGGDFDGTAKPRYWAKSGRIYFQSGFDLFAFDEKAGETKRLTDFEDRGLQPRVVEVAADELKVAISIKENDFYKVKVKRFDAEQFNEIAVSKDQIDYVAWHPNGKDVIFSATVDGTYQIFKVPADGGGTPIQLSTGDLDFFVEDVSSDGDRILYWSQNESSDLWMVNIQDGRESLLADSTASEYWADLSPDGKSVVYQTVAKASRPFSGFINVKSTSEAETPLAISANGFSPSWAKNNLWVAFFRRSEKEVEIWRVDSTGGDARKLTSGGIQSLAYTSTPYLKIGTNQLTFPPNSDAVAYAAKRDGKSNIWLVSSDGLRDEPLTKNEDQAELLCCPTWTPDGKYFVASSNYISPDPKSANTNRLWLYATENSAKKMIFESREKIRFLGIGNGGKDAVIAYMPDSNVSTPTHDLIYINLVSLETGANLRVNTLSNAYFHNIHLSPDGKTIAFVSKRGNVSEVWIVPVGGAPRKVIAENNPKVFISSLSWSSDGKSIVFGKQSQNSLLSMLIK